MTAHVPTVHPPIPTTISDEARVVLEAAAVTPVMANPAPADEAGWQQLGAFAATADPGMVFALALATTGAVAQDVVVPIAARRRGEASYLVAEPAESAGNRALLAIHGGSFTFGGGEAARVSTGLLAAAYGVRTWGMDYRELPDHPFPAGLEDCLTVYRALLEEFSPEKVVVLGQSGGANLAAALMLRARDEGVPLPAGLALLSPPVDLTCAGDSYQTNGFAVAGTGIENVFARYAGHADLRDPHISPLFGDLTGLPPTILTAGTRDFLLSDTVRMHRALLRQGVRAELHVWEGAPHGLFMGRAPEDREQVAQVRGFLEEVWAA
ncbi:alpha/beta hydrolase [Microbacterium sp. Sa4CUA7]|uniref:Alpha/beta hydrolase n=1 Tax=Microbacterium pullorum TaxID=2762236 RepID=A0ABR8S2P1_9MICO|nr:alpha/beta hydrolase [Microbacterium pullorum]MBD7957752.1 alpha/beta hydrolase [Microbacterium pullorum]